MSTSEALASSAASAAKAEGNRLFKAREYAGAIRAYSEAIALDQSEDLHVLYSNRSAAYLAVGDAKSKAFQDAAKCVELAPKWPKAYARKGAAEHALGRFDKAQASYRTALDLLDREEEDKPSSSSSAAQRTSYEKGLEAAKAGEKRATALRIAEEKRLEKLEEERSKRRAADEAAAREAERAATKSGDSLDDFFAAVGDEETRRERAKKRLANPITEKYRTQSLGKAEEHVARLTTKHSEFRNLNPYLVLQLDVDATVDDIKMRYRKLSALCHPDKNLGDDQEKAREAFEAVKSAYNALLDNKTRDRTILVIEGARERAKLENARLRAKDLGIDETDEKAFTDYLDTEIMKTFARNEMKRRDVEEHKRAQAQRERAQEEEQKQKEQAEKQFEEQWNQDDRRATRVDFWSQFQDDRRYGAQKRLRTAKNYKTETKMEPKPKYGQADMESWKKDWK